MGNSRARAVYEANLPDTFTRPQSDQVQNYMVESGQSVRFNDWTVDEMVKDMSYKIQ